MDLAAVAAELFGSMPGGFVAARTAAAKAEPDKVTGKAILALPKPSTAAWLVNMLVRHRRTHGRPDARPTRWSGARNGPHRRRPPPRPTS